MPNGAAKPWSKSNSPSLRRTQGVSAIEDRRAVGGNNQLPCVTRSALESLDKALTEVGMQVRIRFIDDYDAVTRTRPEHAADDD